MNCLRCGTDRKKRLVALVQPGIGPAVFGDERPGLPTEFYVCRNRAACKGRQREVRPARMKVNESDAPPKYDKRAFCPLPDCYCDGYAHP